MKKNISWGRFSLLRSIRYLPFPSLFFALCLMLLLTLSANAQKDSEAAKTDTDAAKPDSQWKVSDPPGKWTDVEIDTDAGTWISLDVSPDGQQIVFDLLGDLYVIPVTGGDAKALTTGIEWDMQPRYSPDGRHIAFTSDRAGGDNIWVMNRDGSDPRQISSEKFRLLNSPAWSPDGNYIAARKHFTSARSLGAGEIWLYHISGGQGLQMTKKPNDQKDVGEPAFSADGRYLYFSRDMTPGPVFEYSKDSNIGIYAIRRLDRDTGDIETLISESGGAIRPTPSPDGKKLAYVRRIRFKTALWIFDLESGATWPVYEQLDRDMQETWAIHGVYPSIGWTPDSRSVVFWSGGFIHKLDLSSEQVSKIPFRVRGNRKIAEALRFPQRISDQPVDLKMLRWVEVAPDRSRVLYQTLGHIYIRDLPEGTPRRLTSQNEHFEFYPSFSRDGKWVVYSSWNDDDLGSIRIVSSAGGEGRKVTEKPGHYLESVFSPDGSRIVYRRVGGGSITSPLWSQDGGIYSISSAGGEPSLVSKEGAGAHFGASNDRVYILDVEEGKRRLISMKLDGAERREHFEGENVTDYRVSPDGKWVAFNEGFNAYMTPLVHTGQKVALSSETKALPVTRVSRDAGDYMHWSGDSLRLYWTLGPQLFQRDLSEAFGFLSDTKEKMPDPPTEGVNLGFAVPPDIPSGKVALVGGRIISMRGDEVIERGTVLIDKNRISQVGTVDAVQPPSDALVIDVSGKTLMPGLIDVHAHGPQGSNEIIPQRNWDHYASLAFGVTTIHDPSNDTSTIFAASEMARTGLITAPRIFSTGSILYGANTPFKVDINSLDDARSHLRRMKSAGAFSVKSYNQPRRDQRQQIIAAARELEMMVVPEGGSLFEHNLTMIVDGHTGIEHSIPVANIYKDTLQLWSASKTGYTPTLVVAYGGIWGENYWYQHTNVWENERLLTFVPHDLVEARSRRRVMAPEEEYNHFNNARICKELTDAGVSVQLGAHGQREGLAAHWELWMFVQGGMSPLEAIRSATLKGAAYLGLDTDLGSIAPGKLADLVVLEENPLENIQNSQKILYTVINGRIFDARTMNQIGNHPSERGLFYWEKQHPPSP